MFVAWMAIGFFTCLGASLYVFRDVWLRIHEIALLFLASAILAIGGPIIAGLIIYWFWQGWSYKFAVDEDDRIIYPWRER